MRLDGLDTRILAALCQDARLSLRALARSAGSTAPTVTARLERLEASGLLQGYPARLDPRSLPGRTRLVAGRIGKESADAFAEAASRLVGVLEGTLLRDGRFQLTLQVPDLEAEEACLAALSDHGAHDLSVRPVRRFLGPGLAHLFHGAITVAEACAVCGRAVGDDPVEAQVDGRRVAFCCTSCQAVYMDRYSHLKERA